MKEIERIYKLVKKHLCYCKVHTRNIWTCSDKYAAALLKTSCCSNGSERLHRCCPLANNVEYAKNIDCGQIWVCQSMFPKSSLSRGGPGVPKEYLVPWTSSSPHPNRHVDWFSSFSKAHQCFQHTQTYRPSVTTGHTLLHIAMWTSNIKQSFLFVKCKIAGSHKSKNS